MHLGGLCLHHLVVSHLLCIYMWHPMFCHVAEASRVLRPMSWHRILCRIIAVKMLRPMSWHCSAATCTSSLCNRTSSSGLCGRTLGLQEFKGLCPSRIVVVCYGGNATQNDRFIYIVFICVLLFVIWFLYMCLYVY